MKLNFSVFENFESEVRSYCRSFPTIFMKGKNALLFNEEGNRYIDFFSGAGALNYGHNPDFIKDKLIQFLQEDRVSHALDMYTTTKKNFLETFVEVILQPRHLDYKVQFSGPAGANSVEAALKLARLVTGRQQIFSFSGGWHGMTLGCLSVTGNKEHRKAAGAPLPFVTFLPYPEGPHPINNSLEYIESILEDPNSGIDKPAAILMETIQAEGGIYIAPIAWLQGLRNLCDRHEILLIIDEIQVGCGRSGPFFSFERAEIKPDIVCMAKSLSGYGLPLAVTLFKRDLDVWLPGQHTGTFRGNQLAFLAGTAALDYYWRDDEFQSATLRKGRWIKQLLEQRIAEIDNRIIVRGLGLILGIDFSAIGEVNQAKAISKYCFENGLIIECCGRDDTVIKILPPLTTEDPILEEGCALLLKGITKYRAL